MGCGKETLIPNAELVGHRGCVYVCLCLCLPILPSTKPCQSQISANLISRDLGGLIFLPLIIADIGSLARDHWLALFFSLIFDRLSHKGLHCPDLLTRLMLHLHSTCFVPVRLCVLHSSLTGTILFTYHTPFCLLCFFCLFDRRSQVAQFGFKLIT